MIDALKRASRQADHRGPAVLPLRPAGQEAPRPRADLRPPDRRPVQDRRRRPADGGRPAHRPDPGLLRRPRRPPHGHADPQRVRRQRSTATEDLAVVSPDAGRIKVAEQWSERLGGAPLAFIHKTRDINRPNEVRRQPRRRRGRGPGLRARRRHDRHRRHHHQGRRRAHGRRRRGVVIAATHAILSRPGGRPAQGLQRRRGHRHQHAADPPRSASSTSSPCCRSPRSSVARSREVFEDGSVTSLFDGRA